MKILDNHLLEGAKLDLFPGGDEMNTRRLLLIHFTSGKTAKSSIGFWRTPEAKGATAHIVIDRDGTIFQCRPFNRTAGHAGPGRKSIWKDEKAGIERVGCNNFSIGIELANAGDSVAGSIEKPHFGSFPIASAIKARHKHGGPLTLWEVFPEPQLAACFELSKALFERYHLDDVRGHEDVSPGRKNDPGPAFPMDQLRALLHLE